MPSWLLSTKARRVESLFFDLVHASDQRPWLHFGLRDIIQLDEPSGGDLVTTSIAVDVALGLAIVCGFGCAAGLAVAEVSLLRVRRSQVRANATNDRRTSDLLALLDDLPAVVNSVLFAVLLCQVAVATISGFLAQRWVGGIGISIASVALSVLLFVYAEALPKTWAMRAPHERALRIARPLRRLVRILRPLVVVLTAVVDLQAPSDLSADPVSERELRLLARQSAQAGEIAPADADLVDRSFAFGDRLVNDIMVRRDAIVSVAADADIASALAKAIEAGHRRIVVVGDGLDDVLGIVRLRDLAAAANGSSVRVSDAMSPPLWCAPDDSIALLMDEMRASGTWLAIARSPAGRTVGLATVEDVVAELMGEIEEPPAVTPPGRRRFTGEDIGP